MDAGASKSEPDAQMQAASKADAAAAAGNRDAAAADGGACPEDALASEQMNFETTGDWPRDGSGIHYQGWVSVERDTADDLVLALQPMAAGDSDAGSDAAGTAHCRIASRRALPQLPIGSRLWLELSNDDDYSGIPRQHAGSRLALKSAEHGALLLAILDLPGSALTIGSLALSARTTLCSHKAQCLIDGRVDEYSVEVRADSSVELDPGARAQIEAGGARYEVWLHGATQTTGDEIDMGCADVVLDDRVWISVEVRALDSDMIASQLTSAPLPSCKLGNDPGTWIDHAMYGYDVSAVVEGEVKYRGTTDSEGLMFDVVGGTGSLGLRDWPLPEPTPGQSFWLSSTFWYFVLRESQAGPIVIASGAFSTDYKMADAGDVQTVSQWLDTPIAVQVACEYEHISGTFHAMTPSHLFSIRIGDAPGVTVASGTTARVALGGVPYDVWVSTDSSYVPLTITQAR